MISNVQTRTRTSRLNILLVEDEFVIAVLLEDMLGELGHTIVGPVGRLNKALEMAERESVDFAILDVNVNGGDTYPVAEALTARGIPFAFSTGYAKNSLPARYRACLTLQKPFQRHDLQKILTQAFH